MQQPDKATIDQWQRWFAVECNNRAWELVEKAERTPAEEREMLDAAHAAAFHWAQVGEPINDARADTLLAHVYALQGDEGRASLYALRCMAFCEHHDCEAWDLAFAHLEMALAAAVSGNEALHTKHYAMAQELGNRLPDEADRKVFSKQFARIPRSVATRGEYPMNI